MAEAPPYVKEDSVTDPIGEAGAPKVARSARRAYLPVHVFSNAFGGNTVLRSDALHALSTRDIEGEANRRGVLCGCDCCTGFGHSGPPSLDSSDLDYDVPDWMLRQDMGQALYRLERALSEIDSRFIGLASDIERHYRRAV